MKIRFLENLAGARECFRAGSVRDMSAEDAAEFLNAGLAEGAEPVLPPVESVAEETPVETAPEVKASTKPKKGKQAE
jgi:hypothetical protein